MMGVPPEDREILRDLADKLLYLNRGEPYRLRPLTQGIEGLMEYVRPKVEARLREPQKDFISVLANGEKIGAMTRHQVLVNTALLLFAGHETTMNLICNGMLAFIRNPEQWARFKSDRGVPALRSAGQVDPAHRRPGRGAEWEALQAGRPDPLGHLGREP
jgi:cytochrome P450